jgi:hypothetical protein
MYRLLRGFAALATIGLLASGSPGAATAQRALTDIIEYIPESSGATQRSYGLADITYYPITPLRSLFRSRFWALDPGGSYVVVRGQYTDSSPFTGTCAFQTNHSGEGECTADFTGLTGLVDSTVNHGGPGGPRALRMR